jgi:hypothetical protein
MDRGLLQAEAVDFSFFQIFHTQPCIQWVMEAFF